MLRLPCRGEDEAGIRRQESDVETILSGGQKSSRETGENGGSTLLDGTAPFGKCLARNVLWLLDGA